MFILIKNLTFYLKMYSTPNADIYPTQLQLDYSALILYYLKLERKCNLNFKRNKKQIIVVFQYK